MPPVYTLPNTCPPTSRKIGQMFRQEAQRMHCRASLNIGSAAISVRLLSMRTMCSSFLLPSVLGVCPVMMVT